MVHTSHKSHKKQLGKVIRFCTSLQVFRSEDNLRQGHDGHANHRRQRGPLHVRRAAQLQPSDIVTANFPNTTEPFREITFEDNLPLALTSPAFARAA